jgi:hypothetical protein
MEATYTASHMLACMYVSFSLRHEAAAWQCSHPHLPGAHAFRITKLRCASHVVCAAAQLAAPSAARRSSAPYSSDTPLTSSNAIAAMRFLDPKTCPISFLESAKTRGTGGRPQRVAVLCEIMSRIRASSKRSGRPFGVVQAMSGASSTAAARPALSAFAASRKPHT